VETMCICEEFVGFTDESLAKSLPQSPKIAIDLLSTSQAKAGSKLPWLYLFL